MDRQARRDREKEQRKENKKKREAMEWLRGLPPAKQLLIDSLVKIEASKETDNIYQAIDRCFSAAIFQEFDFLEYEEVTRAIDISADLMIDDAHKIKDLKDKLGGSYDMAIKKINEMGPKVEARIRELIKEGYNQKLTIKTISEEFKDLSTAMITNSYKKTKALVREEEKLKKVAEREDVSDKRKDITEEVDKEIEDALEYIFEEDTKETKNKAHTEEKEVGQVNTSKIDEKITTKENNKDKKASKLKVIKEVTKVVERYIQGEYGLYNVKGTVVTVDEEFAFSNVEDVKVWASSEREDLLNQIAEIKAKINHINSCELEAIEVIETYM